MHFEFQFDSLAGFFFMQGHGPYVWAAYAITLVSLILLVTGTRIKRRNIVKQIAAMRLRQHDASDVANTRP